MRRLVSALVLATGLGCGGILVNGSGLEAVRQALQAVEPEQRAVLFAQGASEARLVWFGCAEGLSAYANVDPAQRQTILAAMFSDATALCPSTCGGGSALIEELGPLAPADRIRRAIERCDAEGPDPIFGGALAPLRTGMTPLEYLAFRELLERAEAKDPAYAGERDAFAVSLVLNGAPDLAPTDLVALQGSFSPPPGTFTALAERLRACEVPHLRHRLVVAPGGGVAAVTRPSGGECVADVLGTLEFPTAGGWAWVDVTWTVPPADVQAP